MFVKMYIIGMFFIVVTQLIFITQINFIFIEPKSILHLFMNIR